MIGANTTPKRSRFFSRRISMLSLALLLLSSASIGAGIAMNAGSERSGHWPMIEGAIVSGRVDQTQQGNGKGGGVSCYRATILYRYELGAVSYQNTKISYHGTPCVHGERGRRLAEELIARYPANGKVTIFYDPDNPQRSCLEPGKTPDGIGLMLMGAAGFIFLAMVVGGRALDRYAELGEFSQKRGKAE